MHSHAYIIDEQTCLLRPIRCHWRWMSRLLRCKMGVKTWWKCQGRNINGDAWPLACGVQGLCLGKQGVQLYSIILSDPSSVVNHHLAWGTAKTLQNPLWCHQIQDTRGLHAGKLQVLNWARIQPHPVRFIGHSSQNEQAPQSFLDWMGYIMLNFNSLK